MKLYVGLAAAAAAIAMIGAAVAAESDFVIRGDDAKQLLEQNSINVATAEKIAKACVDEALASRIGLSRSDSRSRRGVDITSHHLTRLEH